MWKFGDGTTFEIGGNVGGRSPFAERLRRIVSRARGGYRVSVGVHVQPAEPVQLELDHPTIVDRWLRNEARLAGVEMTRAPAPADLPEIHDPRESLDLDLATDGDVPIA